MFLEEKFLSDRELARAGIFKDNWPPAYRQRLIDSLKQS
jgi:hypothetical protein